MERCVRMWSIVVAGFIGVLCASAQEPQRIAPFSEGPREEFDARVLQSQPTTQGVATQPSSATATSQASALRAAMHEGHAHLARREFDPAVAAFQRALRADASSFAARFNLGLTLFLAARHDEAARELEAAARSETRAAAATYLFGLSLLKADRPAEALAPLRRAVESNPGDPSVLFQHAVALEAAGKSDEAAAALRRVMELDRFHITAPFRLARLERLADRKQEADRLLALSQRNRAILGADAAEREARGLNRFTRPLAMPTTAQPPPWDGAYALAIAPRWPMAGGEAVWPVGIAACIDVDRDARPEILGVDQRGVWRLWGWPADGLTLLDCQVTSRKTELHHAAVVADFDNDGLEDVFFAHEEKPLLLRQSAAARFADATETAGLSGATGVDACWVDIDHDGDTDLLIARGAPGLALYRNRGDGTFADETALCRFREDDAGTASVTRVVAGELNNDDAVDFAAAGDPCEIRFNGGGDDFCTRGLPPTVLRARGAAVAINDVNNDGTIDVAFAESSSRWRVVFSDASIRAIECDLEVETLELADLDRDGFLDVVVGGDGFQVWRNEGEAGWRDITEAIGRVVHPARYAASKIVAADFNGDDVPDLLEMRRAGEAILSRGKSAVDHRMIRLLLTGTKSNRSGVGARIELLRGDLRIVRLVASQPLAIGAGTSGRLDALSVTWPSGITDAQLSVDLGKTITLIEPQVMLGSCPYLYAWDGRGMRYVTDILGNAPLGLKLSRDRLLPADTDEIVSIGPSGEFPPQQTPAGPRHVVETTSELREVMYLDHVKLLALDVPDGCEAHPTDKLQPPPYPPSEVWILRDVRAPARVLRSGAGGATGQPEDVTERVRAIDGVRTGPVELAPSQLRGLARTHSYTMEFGALDTTRPLVLLLTGWLQYGDASVNVAASQNPTLGNPFPTLEASAGERWQPVDAMVAAPAGKSKTILVDLAGKLPRGTTRLRLTTSLEVYWDRIALGERVVTSNEETAARGPAPIYEIPASSARLRFRGVSRSIKPTRDSPQTPVYDELLELPPWTTIPSGWCTRYGDILPLLTEADSKLAIINCGDALRIEFDTSALPPEPAGTRREFFFYSVGWEKDSDHNIVTGDIVEPLPVLGMDDQAYGRPASYIWPDWASEWNTRFVPADVRAAFEQARQGGGTGEK